MQRNIQKSSRHEQPHDTDPDHADPGAYEAFLSDVLFGLGQPQKNLPCKWLYDEAGAHLFEEITQLPEYYLTRTETALLRQTSPELASYLPELSVLIEPGSGSSIKTRILLQALPQLRQYIPLDISEEMLLDTARQLQQDFPSLVIKPLVYDFAAQLPPVLRFEEHSGRLVFFPGSTIGNFSPVEAQRLLRSFSALVRHNGWLLLGVDMTEDRKRLLAAYNDSVGITAQFNKNILARINRELGADFDIDRFQHKAIFNSLESRVEMHLVSTQAQAVNIAGHLVIFEPGETIHTENCYKYSVEMLEQLAHHSGWKIMQQWGSEREQSFRLILLRTSE